MRSTIFSVQFRRTFHAFVYLLIVSLLAPPLSPALLSSTSFADAINSTDFVTTWKTDNPGTSNSTSITIPTNGLGYSYNVDWDNDGIYDDMGLTGSAYHDFGVAGTYTIRIGGSFPRIYFNSGGDRRKILDINQWGNIAWASMRRAFAGASNLTISATDAPDLSGVTDMENMFGGATSLNNNSNLNMWDVSNVTNMRSIFFNNPTFNQPLDNWNVSNVILMNGMFALASSFNQDISGWNTASVTDMTNMFYGAASFNQDISGWITDNATTMTGLFNGASSFNQDISNWNTGNVTDFGFMFQDAVSFNQPISVWNTSNGVNFQSMFLNAQSFDQPLGNWNMLNAIFLDNMFWTVTLSTTNYEEILSGWAAQNVQTGLSFSGGNSLYCDDTARNILTGTKGWTIIDGGSCLSDPVVEFSDAVSSSTNENPGLATNFPVLLVNGVLASPIVVGLLSSGGTATDGVDFIFTDINVTILAGIYDGTLATAVVIDDRPVIVDDTIVEGNETRDFSLANPGIGLDLGDADGDSIIRTFHTYTITDDDRVYVEFASNTGSSTDEVTANNFSKLLVLGDIATDQSVDMIVVGGTATDLVDYSIASPVSIVIPTGSYDGLLGTAIDVTSPTLIDDGTIEGNETVEFNLTNPSPYLDMYDVNSDTTIQGTYIYTITDDDSGGSGGGSGGGGGGGSGGGSSGSGGGVTITSSPTKKTETSTTETSQDSEKNTTDEITTPDTDTYFSAEELPPTLIFKFPSEDPDFIDVLQKKHGKKIVTEEKFQNTCVSKQGKPYYRKCEIGVNLTTFESFNDSILCEGFTVKKGTESSRNNYAQRKQVVGIAVNMKKIGGENVSFTTPFNFRNKFSDVGGTSGTAEWIQPVVETALDQGIISPLNTRFHPDRNVSRVEAYAMIMASVCLYKTGASRDNWERKLHAVAFREGMTQFDWNNFDAQKPISINEINTIASRAADWAERTGGCDKKPTYCFIEN